MLAFLKFILFLDKFKFLQFCKINKIYYLNLYKNFNLIPYIYYFYERFFND